MDRLLDKKLTESKGVEVKDGVFTFTASVEVADRDGDIIIIKGIDTKDYDTNPVFLGMHDKTSKPIGKVIAYKKNIDITPNTFEIDVVFADTEDGREYKYLYENGFMSAVSISFIPKEYEPTSDKSGYIVKSCSLLEVSAVTLPANQYALIKKNLELEGLIKDTTSTLDKLFQLDKKVKELEDKTNKFIEVNSLSGNLDKGEPSKTEDKSIYDKIMNISNKIK